MSELFGFIYRNVRRVELLREVMQDVRPAFLVIGIYEGTHFVIVEIRMVDN
jgi:hypothetical protein